VVPFFLISLAVPASQSPQSPQKFLHFLLAASHEYAILVLQLDESYMNTVRDNPFPGYRK
jgi:hypothetical protein